MIAGIVSHLSGKLRDYHAHFGCDLDEMDGCVALWSDCVLALATSRAAASPRFELSDSDDDVSVGDGGGDGGEGTGRGSEVGAAETAMLRQQAQALIESSVVRHVQRVRVSVEQARDDGNGGDGGDGGADDLAGTIGELCAALAEEFEIEPQFARCFERCMPAPVRGQGGVGGVDAPPALTFALEVLQREVSLRLQPALDSFRTICRGTMAAVALITPLQQLLGSLGVPRPLPQLAELCERMAEGWCLQLPALLQASLARMVELERWVPGFEPTHGATSQPVVTSSAIDVFVELDRLVQVFARFAKLQPLPASAHARFLDVVGSQVRRYVTRLVAGCAPRPHSVLEGVQDDAASSAPAAKGRRKPHSSGLSQPCARDTLLDAQPLRQLCLRLNNCEWASQQILALSNRIRAELPALAALPGDAISETSAQCEAASAELLKWPPPRSPALSLSRASLLLSRRATWRARARYIATLARSSSGRHSAVQVRDAQARLLRPRASPAHAALRAVPGAGGGAPRGAATRKARASPS